MVERHSGERRNRGANTRDLIDELLDLHEVDPSFLSEADLKVSVLGPFDEAVGEAVIRAVQPHGVEAALLAITDANTASSETVLQAERALEEARFRADEARWRYEAVNPDNRLVADNLERLWNDRLEELQACEGRLSRAQALSRPQEFTPEDREAWLSLGADLERA